MGLSHLLCGKGHFSLYWPSYWPSFRGGSTPPPPRGKGGWSQFLIWEWAFTRLQAPERCLKALEVVFGRVWFLFAHLDVAQVERLVWSHTVVSSISPGSSRVRVRVRVTHQHILQSGPRKGPVCGSWLTLKATTRWISMGSNMMGMKGVKANWDSDRLPVQK